MSTKQILSSLAILFVLLALGLALTTLVGRAPATTDASKTSPILMGTSTEGSDYHYTENQPYYTVDVTYPSQVSLGEGAADKAERAMEQALADDINQFKQDGNFANLTQEDVQVQGLGPDRKYALGASYEKYEGSSTVSYVFLVYQDTLGAHPNSFYQTFTFDQDGNLLTLADIFKPDSSYLTVLSPLAYAGVLAELRSKVEVDPQSPELETVRMGTAPSPEALQFYYIDGGTLHLLFPPYQVAAYAAGVFDVAIPLSQLSTRLK